MSSERRTCLRMESANVAFRQQQLWLGIVELTLRDLVQLLYGARNHQRRYWHAGLVHASRRIGLRLQTPDVFVWIAAF